MAAQDAEYWIRRLGLTAHPEGGYFKETYRSPLWYSEDCLQPDYDGSRNASTAIYFLVTADNPSCFHRLGTDEIWHHYAGEPLELIFLDLQGKLTSKWLGKSDFEGCRPQVLAPAGCWFAARVATSFALCGCTMAPGFDFHDFELASRKDLTFAYPDHIDLITALTPEPKH
jgi:predicted cupin superfamily sugar epimerase